MWRTSRRGFALLAVLWIITGAAAIGLGIAAAGRGSIATARNRMELTRAGWRAEDCFERARAAIAEALRVHSRDMSGSHRLWLHLDELVARSPLLDDCDGIVRLWPAGLTMDVNEVKAPELRRVLEYQGFDALRVDSLADALFDWRDGDDEPRAHGAEADWYHRAGRMLPRNGPFGHVDELARVRGFEAWSESRGPAPRDSLATLFTVEPGRIVLELAPLAVLAAMPGLTAEALERIAERRLRGAEPVTDILALGGELSASSRDSLHLHYAELVGRITAEPDAWIISSHAALGTSDGSAGVAATMEARLVRAGPRVAVVRRRNTP